jgi:type I restriction enzyme R subunit
LDFELELILSEDINYDYIISLILNIVKEKNKVKKEAKISEFLKNLKNNLNLRKKEDLIKKFIEENLPALGENADVKVEFEKF